MIAIGGHRGLGCTDHPFFSFRDGENRPVENTAESVIAAFAKGADFVEIDAITTVDHVPIVLHSVVPNDHFFTLPVPPTSLNRIAADAVLACSVGRHRQQTAATFAEMLAVLARHDPHKAAFGVNIEIKGAQNASEPWDGQEFISVLADTVERSAYPPERILWSSFCFDNVQRMAARLPRCHYGMLFSPQEQMNPLFADRMDDWRFCALPFDTIHRGRVCQNGQGWLGYLHPELRAFVRAQGSDALATDPFGYNVWVLRERWDPDLSATIQQAIALLRKAAVPSGLITDEIEQIQAFLGSGPRA